MSFPTPAEVNTEAASGPVGLGIDPIILFSYAASPNNGAGPWPPPDPAHVDAWQQSVYTWAKNIGFDPVYGFGYAQAYQGLPSSLTALQNYLNLIGVRSSTGQLAHDTPTSSGGMIRPGPGDGYVGNTSPSDPGIAVRPFAASNQPIATQTSNFYPNGRPSGPAATPATASGGSTAGATDATSGGTASASGGQGVATQIGSFIEAHPVEALLGGLVAAFVLAKVVG